MTPWMLEAGDSLKRLLQGAVAGALVMAIVGFTWGGWKLGSTEKVTKERAGPTIAAPLLPTSVD